MSCSNKKISKPSVIRIINLETTKMIACLWIIFTLVNVAFGQPNFYTHGRYGKREETPPTGEVNFNFGSRYGRGENIELKTTNAINDKSNEVMARVDRFFLGSRYGKRENKNKNDMINNSNEEKFIYLNNIEDALRYFYRKQRGAKQLSSDNIDYIDEENIKNTNDKYILHKGKFLKWKPIMPKVDSANPMNSCEK